MRMLLILPLMTSIWIILVSYLVQSQPIFWNVQLSHLLSNDMKPSASNSGWHHHYHYHDYHPHHLHHLHHGWHKKWHHNNNNWW